jgi:SAM-dependent methyltransferase
MFRAFWDRLGGRLLDLALCDVAIPEGPLRVVEPACGEGFLGAAIERTALRRGIDVAYTGSDLSEGAIELARGAVSGTVMVGDATEVLDAMPARSQDVVVAKNLLHHIEDPERFVAAAARVVGPQGSVLIVEARLGCVQCFAISLLNIRRERYFFRGRNRSLRALRHGGVHLVGSECFNVLPFEIAFHIRPAIFRRLFSTSNPATLDRVTRADQRLERLAPWMAHYYIWRTVPAAG